MRRITEHACILVIAGISAWTASELVLLFVGSWASMAFAAAVAVLAALSLLPDGSR